MRTVWPIVRGPAGVAAGVGLVVLAALAIGLTAASGPRAANAAALDPANLSVTVSDNPDPVATGATLTYTIRVHNAGPDPATNTVLTDSLGGTVTFVSVSASAGDCNRSGSKVTCDLDTVTTTDRIVTIRTTVKKKRGEITNSASVSSEVTDPNAANNLDTEVTKIFNPKPIECAGQPVTILGTPGPDTLIGTAGDDVILADGGDDTVFGFRGGDLICAGRGSDVVRGGAGNDAVLGRAGSDRIWGRRGDDALRGGRGRDRLRGGRGRDRLRGGRGRDRLRGGGGDDLLAGGRGFDRCRGGAGIDTERSCER